jgi:HlyD family secretion protein
MSATVDIRTKQVSDVLTVPIQSVTTRTKEELEQHSEKRKSGNKGKDEEEEESSTEEKSDDSVELVFVVSDGKVLAKQVTTGIQDNEFIEIVSGVNDGDEVVTAPYRAISKKLGPGDEVEVVSEDELYKSKDQGGFGD